jgi:poly-gamma-glutamate synthase PgsB/CapB
MKQFKIKVNGKEYLVEVEEIGTGNTPQVAAPVVKTELKEARVETVTEKPEAKKEAAVTVSEGEEVIVAPMPGKILKINVSEGDTVQEGDTIVILEAMKMENEIVAGSGGKVKKIHVAVHPETQWVSEHKIVYSTIGIITNIREDHQDVYGPDLQDAANSLKSTIPNNGILVTADRNFFSLFQKQAERLNTKTILVEPENINFPKDEKSENIFFKENVAIALQTGQLLNIEENICWQGILKAKPDPGALTIYKLRINEKRLWFVNAFAANDRESILLIWEKVKQLLPEKVINSPKFAILNNRGDRITRIIQFTRILSKEIAVEHIFLVGQNTRLSNNQLIQNGYPARQITPINDLDNINYVLQQISQFIEEEGMVYGLGNTRGFGLKLMDYLQKNGEKL